MHSQALKNYTMVPVSKDTSYGQESPDLITNLRFNVIAGELLPALRGASFELMHRRNRFIACLPKL